MRDWQKNLPYKLPQQPISVITRGEDAAFKACVTRENTKCESGLLKGPCPSFSCKYCAKNIGDQQKRDTINHCMKNWF